MGSTDTQSFLQSVLLPHFHPGLSLWLKNATSRQLNGLKILQSICKHKGNKKLHLYSPVRKRGLSTAAAQSMKKRPLIARGVLNTETESFVNRWMDLKAPEQQILLLQSLLKGIQSIGWIKNRPKNLVQDLNSNSADFVVAHKVASPQERKMLFLRGNGNHTNWISFVDHGSPRTMNGSFYEGQSRVNSKGKDFRTSYVFRMMPERKMNYHLMKTRQVILVFK